MQLLDGTLMFDALDARGRSLVSAIDIHASVDSTNSMLKLLGQGGAKCGHVLFAEHQSEGRGRRGRLWISPFASSIYMSLLWRYPQCPANFGGLSLAVAVAAARAIEAAGLHDVKVKWPNDLLWQGKKLAGILLELNGEADGNCTVVAGIGVNMNLGSDAGRMIGQPWVDMRQALQRPVDRNLVAATLAQSILAAMCDYPQTGLHGIVDEWDRFDAMRGREVVLSMADQTITGIARGIDVDGALLLERGDRVERIHSGEVSLRAV